MPRVFDVAQQPSRLSRLPGPRPSLDGSNHICGGHRAEQSQNQLKFSPAALSAERLDRRLARSRWRALGRVRFGFAARRFVSLRLRARRRSPGRAGAESRGHTRPAMVSPMDPEDRHGRENELHGIFALCWDTWRHRTEAGQQRLVGSLSPAARCLHATKAARPRRADRSHQDVGATACPVVDRWPLLRAEHALTRLDRLFQPGAVVGLGHECLSSAL